jgi:hypothetical protein
VIGLTPIGVTGQLIKDQNKYMYDLMFYSFYCLISKRDSYVMERASFLVSMVSFNLLMIILLFIIILLNIESKMILIASVVIGLTNGYFTDKYFKKSDRMKEIIKSYNQENSNRAKWKYSLLASVLFLGSTGMFILSGITLSKHLNPW